MSLKRAPDIFIFIIIGLTLLIRTHCDIILSELRTSPRNGNGYNDNKEFIELYNPDAHPVSLDGYTIVLYNGDSNRAYGILSLQHGGIEPHSYYTIGSSNVSPQPNHLLDEKSNVNLLPSGAAVALYYGNGEMFVYNMQATNVSLIDALVYGEKDQRSSFGLSLILTHGQTVFLDGNQTDTSISLCNGESIFQPWGIQPTLWTNTTPTPSHSNNCTHVSSLVPPPLSIDAPPESLNDLPPLTDADIPQIDLPPYDDISLYHAFVVINEFDIDSQFIELYDGGTGDVTLDGLMVVFYSGANSAVYANPINLNGQRTDSNGYLLIAPANHFPDLPHLELTSSIRSDGVNAIAIHFGMIDDFVIGSSMTTRYLVDAVVYGDIPNPEDNDLVRTLSQGHVPLTKEDREWDSNYDARIVGDSLSRCRGWAQYMPESFRTVPASPLADNVCEIPTTIVINEVNVIGETGNEDQYIELYDGGLGHQSLNGLVLALYDGETSMLQHSYDLTGRTTNSNGFAVIGFVNNTHVDIPVTFDLTNELLQPTLGAVALHLGPLPRFRRGASVSTFNLVDAIVYSTDDDPNLRFLHSILPLQDIPNELAGFGDEDHSVSRCACCAQLDSSAFGLAPASPGEINMDCMRNSEIVTETLEHYQNVVRINEVRVDGMESGSGEFLEIYDDGFGGVPLDNIVVAIYNGNGDERSHQVFPLGGYQTNSEGYLVIGTQTIIPIPRIVVPGETLLPNQVAGAVALYKVATEDLLTFNTRTRPTRDGLIDVMVYGNAQDFDLELAERLILGQSPVNIDGITDHSNTSILRCFSRQPSEQLGFTMGQSSPGSPNLCPLTPVIINEVNVQSLAEDVGEFVELSSKGVANFPLNNLNLIFWRGRQETAARICRIDGHRTDSNGFFLIGYEGLISPRPDMTPFPRYTNYIKDASNVISLHVGRPSTFYFNMPVTDEGLIDGVAYRNPHEFELGFPSSILETLTPGVEPGVEPFLTSPSNRDESINRCLGPSGEVSWDAGHVSPKASNHCRTRADAELVINEFCLVASEQFVELWDKGAGYTSLDDFIVILYGKDSMSYLIIPLTGYTTDSMGYFVMGVSTVVPHVQFVFADGFLHSHIGAIALYRTSEGQVIPDSVHATADGLLDAVAYSNQDGDHELLRVLTGVLTPDSNHIPSSFLQISGASLSRCMSHHLRNSSAFAVTPATPKTMNDCPIFADDIFINEVNVEQPGGRSREFIELYDGGRGNTPLTYLCLVLFNGHNDDRSYATFDLDGYSTNDKGFFLIASDRVRLRGADISIPVSRRLGLLQNGPDAVAIYRAPSGAFPYDTDPTTKSLIDAIVYNTGDGLSHTLVDKLLPGQSMVHEDSSHLADDESISRCHGNHHRDPLVYSLSLPTPGRENDCSDEKPSDQPPIFYISEISVTIPGQDFVELCNGGDGSTSSLNGFILVFYNGDNGDRSYLEVDLHGARTNEDGYFLIGNKNVHPTPDLIIPDNIHEGPDAIVLYHAKLLDFLRGTGVNPHNIVDALVYGKETSGNESLLKSLAPGQVISEVTSGMTLSRCMMGHAVTMSAFHDSIATPGAPNDCSQAHVILSEISLGLSIANPTGHMGHTGQSMGQMGQNGQYIELYDGGRGGTSLSDYILMLYSETEGKAYKKIVMTGCSTSSDGYFILGDPSSFTSSEAALQTDFVLPPGFIAEGAGAIALYKSHAITAYTPGMTPTAAGLIDVAVYGTSSAPAVTLMDALLPGQQQICIDEGMPLRDWSISRCSCCETRQTSKFGIGTRTPSLPNNCSPASYSLMLYEASELVINEIKSLANNSSGVEFVELKGAANAPLDEYTVVIFTERGRSSYVIDLTEMRTDQYGLVVIGSSGMRPQPTVTFPGPSLPIIPQTTGAVVLYRGVTGQFLIGTALTNQGLVDAVVFTNDQTELDNELKSVLTPQSPSFYAENSWWTGDQSISRCQCCKPQTNSAFLRSRPTPHQPNLCPGHAKSATIQITLVNAAYRVWVENANMVLEFKRAVATGIERFCRCGFNEVHLADEKVMNGSVIYQATLLAFDSEQSALIVNSFVKYIRETSVIRLHGTSYAIEGLCIANCSGNNPVKPKARRDLSPAEEEAIAVLCIVFTSVIIASIYLVIRYRDRIWAIAKRRYNSSPIPEFPVIFRRAKNDKTSALPESYPNANSVESFANPVYMYQGPRETDCPTIVIREHSASSGRSSPRNMVHEHVGGSGRSSPKIVDREQSRSGRTSPMMVPGYSGSGRNSPRIVVQGHSGSGRNSPRIVVQEHFGSGRKSPMYNGSGRYSPSIMVEEQCESGRGSPRDLSNGHSPKEKRRGIFNSPDHTLAKVKKILDKKGNFENPLYGLSSSPVPEETYQMPKEENAMSVEKKIAESNIEDHVQKKSRFLKRANKKDKQPESFANPVYGCDASPAQLQVSVEQDSDGAEVTTGNQVGPVDEGIKGKVQNSEGVKTTGDHHRSGGVREGIFMKLKRSLSGRDENDREMSN